MGAAESNKKYRESEKGKATAAKWLASDAGKASRQKYLDSERGKDGHSIRIRRYLSKPEKLEITRKANQNWRVRVKHETFVAYSQDPPVCACCGENTEAFLTLDHVHGGGRDHRASFETSASNFYAALRKAGFPMEPELQVLCFNCNCGKRSNGGVCPHETAKRQA